LLKELNAPLLTTTLAHDGLDVEEFTDPSLIYDQYKNQVDMVLDCGFGGFLPSSVIDLTEDLPIIVREGAGQCADFK
jgi:tRNA A37 threonylcarbamoyladenosine synthetase subunit TsaC/SUA5/YrdC